MRTKTLAVVALPILFAVTVASESPMHRGGPEHSGAASALTVPAAVKWQWLGESGAKSLASPAVAGGVVYVGLGGQVTAMRLADGGVLWEYPSGQKIPASFRLSPAVGDGLVFCAASDASLYVLSADTGRLVWQFNARVSITTPPTYANGVVYIGTNDGRVFALDGKSGNPIWTEPYNAGGAIQGPVCVAAGNVIALTEDGIVHGLTPPTGKVRYRQRLTGLSRGAHLAAVGEHMFVNSGNALVALSPANGRARWTKQLGAPAALSPASDGRNVYTATEDGKVFAFDMSGRQTWQKPATMPYPLEASPTIAGDTLILPLRRGLVYGLDSSSGETLWAYLLKPPPGLRVSSGGTTRTPTWSSISSEPSVADDTLLVLTEYGQLFAFSAKDAVDLNPPTVNHLIPAPGDMISGRPPLYVQVGLEDLGSGIVQESVELLLDNEPLEPTGDTPLFDPLKGIVLYQMKSEDLVRPLADGRHTFEVRARDWMGNQLSRKWDVTIDNSLPPGIPKSRSTDDLGGGGGRGGRTHEGGGG